MVLVLAALLLSASANAQERWKIQFFYDKPDSALDLADLQCPSLQRCIAAGTIFDKYDRRKGVVVLTRDGGAHWSLMDVKENPLSLFFLNDSLGWMVTDHGVWTTDEGGLTWKKLEGLKGILRVHFLDPSHGYAIGLSKSVYETTDGGAKWTKLLAASEPVSDPKQTVYDCINFLGEHGVILGTVQPPEDDYARPNAPARPEKNSLVAMLETLDGGKTWHPKTDKLLGEITQVNLAKEGIVLLVEYRGNYSLPSSVFNWPRGVDKLEVAFAERNRAVTSMALLPDGGALLAAIEPPGPSNRVPIPGKLKMLRSQDLKTWQEIDVDYKAIARQAVVAAPDARHAWVATDTGMILGLMSSTQTE